MCPLPTFCPPLATYWGWRIEWGRESLMLWEPVHQEQNMSALSIKHNLATKSNHSTIWAAVKEAGPVPARSNTTCFLRNSVADCSSSNSLFGRKKVVLIDKQRVEVTLIETQLVLLKVYLCFEAAAQKHSYNKFQYQEDKWWHNTKENPFCDCDVKEKGK